MLWNETSICTWNTFWISFTGTIKHSWSDWYYCSNICFATHTTLPAGLIFFSFVFKWSVNLLMSSLTSIYTVTFFLRDCSSMFPSKSTIILESPTDFIMTLMVLEPNNVWFFYLCCHQMWNLSCCFLWFSIILYFSKFTNLRITSFHSWSQFTAKQIFN